MKLRARGEGERTLEVRAGQVSHPPLPNLGALLLPRLGVLPLLRLVVGLLVRYTLPLPRLGVLPLLRLVAGLLVRRTLPLPCLGVLPLLRLVAGLLVRRATTCRFLALSFLTAARSMLSVHTTPSDLPPPQWPGV